MKVALVGVSGFVVLSALDDARAAAVYSLKTGLWSTVDTWSASAAPLSTDDAIIASGATVTYSSGTSSTVRSVIVGAAGSTDNILRIDSGNLSVTGNVTFGNQVGNKLEVNSGGSLTLTGVSSRLDVSKSVVVGSGAAVTLSGANSNLNVLYGGSLAVTGGAITTQNYTNGGFLNDTAQTTINGGTLNVRDVLSLNQSAGFTLGTGTTAHVGTLAVSDGASSHIQLAGGSSISVAFDYTNQAFGSGNSFDARANMGGTGSILALNNNRIGLKVDGGATVTTDTNLSLNVHVGAVASKSYVITNTGDAYATDAGPRIRGAIQNIVSSASTITDARLTGTGVQASDIRDKTDTYTYLARDGDSKAYTVSFNGSTAGALANQSVRVVDNFGNTQTLSITGAAYNLASATLGSSSVGIASQHVGDANSAAVSVTNSAASGDYSEKLNAAISASTGAAVYGAGSVSLLAAQATDSSSLSVGVDTSSAGAKTGTATISLTSDGKDTSGLGQTALTSQTVNVSGNVWNYAAAELAKTSGVGSLGHNIDNTVLTFNFGKLQINTGRYDASLQINNKGLDSVWTDLLGSTFTGNTGHDFGQSLWASFDGIAGQSSKTGLALGVDTSSLTVGSYTASIILNPYGYNTDGYNAAHNSNLGGPITLNLIANVTAVSEPGVLWLVASAGLGWFATRRKKV